MTNPRASTTSGLLFLVLLLAAKIAAMTTCADITFDSCGENEKGDWARGDWQPSLSQFDAKRQCIAYNKYVKPWRTKKQLDYCKLDLDDARTYLDGTLTKNATFNARPTMCQFNHWYCAGSLSFCANATRISGNNTAVRADQHYRQMLQFPRNRCAKYLRTELLTAGDPDIAGPGVMISYSIEAFLVLLYLLAHYLPATPTLSSQGLLHRTHAVFIRRLHTATASSIHSLYATATILSYSIVTAAAAIFGIHQLKKSLVDIYMNELLVLAPTFSIFPVLAVHTLLPGWKGKPRTSERITAGWEGRNRFRRVLGSVLYLFCLVTVWYIRVTGIRTTDPNFEFGGKNDMWDVRLSHDVYMVAPRYVEALVILMLVVPGVGIVALCGLRWFRRRRGGSAQANTPSGQSSGVPAGRQAGSARTRSWIMLAIRALSVAMMLIQLTWLWYLRTEAMHDAGGIDRDTEWNFGQILAVATWLPVLMEFIYFFVFSNRQSNTGVESAIPLAPVAP